MSSSYGENIRITIFGQSHAPAIGVTVEGLPAGRPSTVTPMAGAWDWPKIVMRMFSP